MKTLLERAEALLSSARDWFNGKEQELHRQNAEIVRDAAKEIEALTARVKALEDRIYVGDAFDKIGAHRV